MVKILMSQNEYKLDPRFAGGLLFGDPAQIQYIKAMVSQCAYEDEQCELGLKLFKVGVIKELSYEIDVWAEGEFEAIEQANERLDTEDYHDSEVSYEIMCLTEVPD